jgi:uncharacterized protein (DUF58 family)
MDDEREHGSIVLLVDASRSGAGPDRAPANAAASSAAASASK